MAIVRDPNELVRRYVAMEDPDGLTPSARTHYEDLVSRLRADTTHVLLVQDLLADPVTATQALSQDGKAWYLPVGVAGTLGDPAAAESVSARGSRDCAAGRRGRRARPSGNRRSPRR